MIIFRYLAKEVVMTTLVVSLILLVVFVTNQSLQFFQRAANGAIPATELLSIVALQVPLLLGYLLPLGFYLGVLLTLGRWHFDSEMTVLSACGVSRAMLTGMIVLIAFLVALVVSGLTAFVVPKAQGDINRMLSNAAASTSIAQIIPDRFMEFGGKDFVVPLSDTPGLSGATDNTQNGKMVFYARNVGKGRKALHDIFVAQKEGAPDHATKTQKWGVVVAKSATEKVEGQEGGRYLIFENGYRYSGVPGQKDYRVVRFDQYGVRISVNAASVHNDVQSFSVHQLWQTRHQDLNAAAELQWRMTMPICTIIFALIAVPLCQVRPRYGKFTQLFPAIIIFAVYANLILVMRTWIQAGRIAPEWGMWWVHAAALLLAGGLMLYRMGWHRLRAIFSRAVTP